ncbi:MAG: SagB/ThcOx family dehydrogenase [Acidobacteria bacterium]|nr:SagB/ThcOx family dehydrogenase [Acidobacteriota bacterium]
MKSNTSRTRLEMVLAYHERTKHHPARYAPSPGYLDWQTQPDPFRRYDGSVLVHLDEIPPSDEPNYLDIFQPEKNPCRAVDRASLSQLFYDSLAISAWKELGAARWSLRVNPSSGNLHPTESYLLAAPVAGLWETPTLSHYSPFHHGLEIRAPLPQRDWQELTYGLPDGVLLVGLTSIHWRESWKYGERAFRYCHHDVGHAIAALALSASLLGWQARYLDGCTDPQLAGLLGVADQEGPEVEHPDCLLALFPAGEQPLSEHTRILRPAPELMERLSRLSMAGRPNQLSPQHRPWPVIHEVAAATLRAESGPASSDPTSDPGTSRSFAPTLPGIAARKIVRQRRSAVAMDGMTSLKRETFFGMMARVLPRPDHAPFSSLPWKPGIHLLIFVHRVEGLEPGLYCLFRHATARHELRTAMRSDFQWSEPTGCPADLPLALLQPGDCRAEAREVSCGQDIAADGAFALAMIAEFEPSLRRYGAWFYKRLHWEAGALGQVLYLEAEAAGVRSTGIGCFFDDELHRIFGLAGNRYQDLYHFTVGGPVHDDRLRDLPAYGHR